MSGTVLKSVKPKRHVFGLQRAYKLCLKKYFSFKLNIKLPIYKYYYIIIADNKEINLKCQLEISAIMLIQHNVLANSTKVPKELIIKITY